MTDLIVLGCFGKPSCFIAVLCSDILMTTQWFKKIICTLTNYEKKLVSDSGCFLATYQCFDYPLFLIFPHLSKLLTFPTITFNVQLHKTVKSKNVEYVPHYKELNNQNRSCFMCCHTQHHHGSIAFWKQAVLHLLRLCLHRRGRLPDSCFRYRAIQQRAETSVKTPHPMAVHCLLHTVNCGTHTRSETEGSLTISHTGIKTRMHDREEHLTGLSLWTVYFCGCLLQSANSTSATMFPRANVVCVELHEFLSNRKPN